MLKRPPVPKFHEECNTPKRNQDMYELISDIVFKMNLDDQVEKKSISIFNDLSIPNSYMHAQALVYCAMSELQYKVPEADEKLLNLAKCIQQQHSSLITTLCKNLKIDSKATTVCVTLLRQIQPLIQKLPKSLQNAIAVKIATDIIYLKQGGINIRLIAYQANITPQQLQTSINRIRPFAFQIIQDLFNYFNHHSI
ncbi:unnamed protein product (macronuclear) [Paramecium tetraurelia]|uniref:Uncharacterized protein n=1 Tax=Paramecium tetraurelia TaxID=5888 RepID=A0EE70_PARTE|nr:uncharacterized protein GSPATT00025931001 [Paramecium tetraurelia]CAK93587.1 unnamed protein product [Paramecium tetraurelia]|eukprot:XP_001460984.1 hypothetical protein (macronuclear) [Paramecium tetraurelia strain d4-2]